MRWAMDAPRAQLRSSSDAIQVQSGDTQSRRNLISRSCAHAGKTLAWQIIWQAVLDGSPISLHAENPGKIRSHTATTIHSFQTRERQNTALSQVDDNVARGRMKETWKMAHPALVLPKILNADWLMRKRESP